MDTFQISEKKNTKRKNVEKTQIYHAGIEALSVVMYE